LNCPDQEVVQKIGDGVRDALDREAEFQRQNPGPSGRAPARDASCRPNVTIA
jgi:hypothetical protein